MNGINKLALGTVQFGLDYGVANSTGRVLPQMASSILTCAYTAGINTLDTAIAYGDSESVLGTLGISNWKVVTKLPAVPDNCCDIPKWVADEVHASLQRLRTNKLHALMLHRPAQLLEPIGKTLYGALQTVKTEGLANKIGVSVYGVKELEQIFQNFQFDIVQAPFNILDRRLVTSGWASRLQQVGVEVHSRSAFLQGLLLMPEDQRPKKFQRWANIWSEWSRWLKESGLTPLEACTRYVCGLDCIDRVVVGVDNTNQLQDILDSAQGPSPNLPDFEFLADDRLINPASWSQL